MWFRREYFPPSRPRKAVGGIKAQSKKGRFGESWWAQRWIGVLESFDIGARLGRGRSYARRGQVLSVDIEQGQVKAKVQGSRPKPYDITIAVKTLSKAEWAKVQQALTGQALFVAKLLAGEMPQDIEQVFQEVKLSLFPERLRDLTTQCSCPDWSNPCKHIAAVYYLLGEEFDRDPFLVFKLRGLGREELLAGLGGSAKDKKPPKASRGSRNKAKPKLAAPLPADPAAFWKVGDLPETLFGEVQPPPVSAALPKRLGNFPFWRGEERFLDAVGEVYRLASQRATNVFLGEGARLPGAPEGHGPLGRAAEAPAVRFAP
jgi:uncharacterized Zn finger protein